MTTPYTPGGEVAVPKGRAKTHLVTIRVSVNVPITAAEARYAAWSAIDGLDLCGAGDPSTVEPWDHGKIRVSRSALATPSPAGEN